jgi:hypothetical protein
MAHIAKTLNKEKVGSKTGAAWSTGSIKSLLENCNYIGRVRYGTEQPDKYLESEGRHEPIIDVETFEKAQIILANNKFVAPTKRPTEKNYFNGLLLCGVCGKNMKSHIIYSRVGKPQYNFECMDRTFSACSAKRVSATKVETAVIEYFKNAIEIISDSDTEKDESEKEKTVLQLAALNEKLATLEIKEKEMLDTYIIDEITLLQYRDYKTQLGSEKAKILKEIEKLKPKEKVKNVQPITKSEIIAYFNENWATLNDIEKRQFLTTYIGKFTVINHPVKNSNRGRCEVTETTFNTN